MRAGRSSNIVSINAHCGAPDLAVYSASKAALANMTRNAANAHARDRIRVNGINVGWSLTPTEQALQSGTLGHGPGWLDAANAASPFGAAIRAAGDRRSRRVPAQRRHRPNDRRAR